MAVSAFTPYNSGITNLVNGTLNYLADNVQAMLLNSSYTPNVSSHQFVSDVSAYEVPSTGGYARVSLTGKTVTTLGSGFTMLSCSNISFGNNVSITAKYLVVFDAQQGSPSAQPLLLYVDLNTGQTVPVMSSNSVFQLDVGPTAGILQINPT